MATVFGDVQRILQTIVDNWTAGNGAPPDFVSAHGSNLDFSSKDALLASKAKNLWLIQKEIIGVQGQGHTANIVVALVQGVGPFPRMPFGGLDSQNGVFLDINSPQVQTIIDWIEGGCLP